MQATFFTCEHLEKRYQGKSALSDISLTLEKNEIYGLIGQNGAGKTTLMRVMAGLTKPDGGDFTLLEQSSQAERASSKKKFGFLLEAPALLGDLNAQENYKVRQMLYGIQNEREANAALELLGLSTRKKVRAYSLGMRQRLGIALTLAGKPEVLVLDEPTNGLDPGGVADVRGILRRLWQENGLSVLISSHNLAELYQTATRFIFIHKGRVLQECSHVELENSCESYFCIESDSAATLENFCHTVLRTDRYRVIDDGAVQLYWPKTEKENISKALFEHGIFVKAYSFEEPSLEQYFLRLIGGETP